MTHAVVGRPPRLPFGELAEVIVKTLRAAAVVTHPKRRLGHDNAAHPGHRGQIVGGSRRDVNVRARAIHQRQDFLGVNILFLDTLFAHHVRIAYECHGTHPRRSFYAENNHGRLPRRDPAATPGRS